MCGTDKCAEAKEKDKPGGDIMKPYREMSREELLAEHAALEAKYLEIKAKGLNLDMSRGKPAKAQLDLANGMMDVLGSTVSLFREVIRTWPVNQVWTAVITVSWTEFRRREDCSLIFLRYRKKIF